MVNLHLLRYAADDQGTHGWLVAPGFSCATMELPWRDNKTSRSRIPDGDYRISMVTARRPFSGMRELYLVHDVPGRSGILIHIGNYAGDTRHGFKTNSWGCILPGQKPVVMAGQRAVAASRMAILRFHDYMAGREGQLRVRSYA